MSYILDALKKVEHEKSKKSRVTGMINLSGSLFEHERSTPEGKAGWKVALAVTAAVLLTFAVTWHFLPKLTGRGPVSPKPVVQVPQTLPVKVEPTPSTALAPPAGMPSAQPTAPSTQHPAPPLPLQPPASKPLAAVQVMPASDDEDDETRRAARRRHKNVNVQASPVAASVAAPADLKLSGIAYQDERRARRAVVNGFLLQEGAVVSGAVITDIYQDRVRFSLAGKSFELSLAATGIPAAGK